jgi:hypothetical protein
VHDRDRGAAAPKREIGIANKHVSDPD